MSNTVVILSAVLIAVILYLLVNSYVLLKNKLNDLIKIQSRRRSVVYMLLSLCFVPLLYMYAEHDRKMVLAKTHGFTTHEAYLAQVAVAQSHSLTITEYQNAMVEARKAGFTTYTDHQNHLEANAHDYSDYATYNRDSRLAKSYDLPLAIYRQAKADADAKNFEYFDDYLLDREKKSLAVKLEKVANLEGDYNIDTVPLGAKRSELLSLIDDCKISQMPNYSFPITKTLAPRADALVSHFFPETSTNSNFGLTSYSMNFTVMPGLDLKAITKYEMKCEGARYDLWFLKSDNSLVFYEKTLSMPNIRKFEPTVARIEGILNSKCDTEISVGLDTQIEEHGTRAVKNLYCKSFQEYIIATIVDGPIITGVRQDPDIHIGYLNDRLWKKYINNLHAAKGKKQTIRFSQASSDTKNTTKTIESRI